MRTLLVFLLALLLAPVRPGAALVDMNSASYSNNFVDIEISGTGFEFQLLRAYKSRTLYSGLFGFGWCSTLETRLMALNNDEIVMATCGDGAQTYFVREGAQKNAERDYHIRKDRLQAAMDRLGFDDAVRAEQFELLASGPDLNKIEILELGAGARKLPIGTFVSSTGGRLVSSLSGVTSNLVDDFSQLPTFDAWGKLTAYSTPGGERVQIEQIGLKSLRVRVRHNQIDLLLDEDGRHVKEIKVNGETRATYEYSAAENDDFRMLIANTNQWGGRYVYQYNEYLNLTRMEWPDATSVLIEYDNEKDWVIAFTDRRGCKETYTYSFTASPPEGFENEGRAILEAVAPFKSDGLEWQHDPKFEYWSGVVKTCGTETTARNAYYFVHTQSRDTEGAPVLLALVATFTDGKSQAIAYADPDNESTFSTYPLRTVSKFRRTGPSSSNEVRLASLGAFSVTRSASGTFSTCKSSASVDGRFIWSGTTTDVSVKPEFDAPKPGACEPDQLVVEVGGVKSTLRRSGEQIYSSNDFTSSINVAAKDFAATCHLAENLPLTEGIRQAIAGKLPCSPDERAILVLTVFETFGIY